MIKTEYPAPSILATANKAITNKIVLLQHNMAALEDMSSAC